jgi:hypothetical protein
MAEVAKRKGVELTSLADFAMSEKAGGAAIVLVAWAGFDDGGGTCTKVEGA